MSQGIFIALEGAENSNTAAQFHLLKERLTAIGHEVATFKFPSYEGESSYFIKRYLGGFYGPLDEVSPYSVALFYALDRFDQAAKIKEELAKGKIVLAHSYVGSTMATQVSSFSDLVEQRGFFIWEDSLEYQLLGIPRPSISILLDPDGKTSAFKLLSSLFPRDFSLVQTIDDSGTDLNISALNNKIWEVIKPQLPKDTPKPPRSMTVNLSEALGKEVARGDKKAPVAAQKDEPYKTKVSFLTSYDMALAGLEATGQEYDWAKDNFSYYTPEDLPKKIKSKYAELIDKIAEHHKDMLKKLKKAGQSESLLLAATPLAATRTIVIDNTPDLANTLRTLALSSNEETRNLAAETTKHSSLANRTSTELKTSPQKQPESIEKIISKLVNEHLPQNLSEQKDIAKLVEVSPKNEFKLVAEATYPISNIPKTELEEEIDSWSYARKSEVLEAALKSQDAGLLSKVNYEFDLTADRVILNEFIKRGLAEKLKTQPPTPRYGYEVPKEIDDAGITNEYLDCFDISLELFSSLQAADRESLASYATLVGHKGRFQLNCTLWDLLNLFKGPADAQIKDILEAIRTQIAQHHPIIALTLEKQARTEEKAKESTPVKKTSHRRRRRRSGNRSQKS